MNWLSHWDEDLEDEITVPLTRKFPTVEEINALYDNYKGHQSISTNEYKAHNIDFVINKSVVSVADLPSAEEYKKSMESKFRYAIYNEWSEPKYKCPKCDGGMCRNEMIVLTSYPEQYEYRCNKCGHVEYHPG